MRKEVAPYWTHQLDHRTGIEALSGVHASTIPILIINQQAVSVLVGEQLVTIAIIV